MRYHNSAWQTTPLVGKTPCKGYSTYSDFLNALKGLRNFSGHDEPTINLYDGATRLCDDETSLWLVFVNQEAS